MGAPTRGCSVFEVWHCRVQAYARSRTDAPELVDLVAGGGGGGGANTGNGVADVDMADAPGGQKGAKRKRIFDDHRPMSAITAGIKAGALHQVRPHHHSPLPTADASMHFSRSSVARFLHVSGRGTVAGTCVALWWRYTSALLWHATWHASAHRTIKTSAANPRGSQAL